jgi:hypothetical protein
VDEGRMESKDAVEYVMSEYGYGSYSEIARALSSSPKLTVQPIQVSNYHKGVRSMGEKVAEEFYFVFGIEIVDAYRATGRPEEW